MNGIPGFSATVLVLEAVVLDIRYRETHPEVDLRSREWLYGEGAVFDSEWPLPPN
jgi:hypothetical protein